MQILSRYDFPCLTAWCIMSLSGAHFSIYKSDFSPQVKSLSGQCFPAVHLSLSTIMWTLTVLWGRPWAKNGPVRFSWCILSFSLEMWCDSALTVHCSASNFTYSTLWSCLGMMSYRSKIINWTVCVSSTKLCKTSKGAANRISVTWLIFLYSSARLFRLYAFQFHNEFWNKSVQKKVM